MIFALLLVMVAMLAYERYRAARHFPVVRHWTLRSVIIIGIQIGVVELGAFFWDNWFSSQSILSLARWGEPWATLTAFMVISFISYWQHRFKHRFDFLWRYLHQVHHAPTRIEILTSFYRNPAEILLNMLLMSYILYGILGTGVEAATNVVFLMGAADLFYHWNISTPRWLGFIIQRPEAHCIHHMTGVHAYNYGDIPLWDIIFGTYRNVRNFDGACGFGADEYRFGAMLLGRNLAPERVKH